MSASVSLPVETPRLRLRAPRPEDAQAIYAFASDADVTRFVGWPRHTSLDDTRSFLEFSALEWSRWPLGPLLVESRADDAILGSTGLSFETDYRAATGYVLAREFWGRGYATEALAAVVTCAQILGVQRLYALCHCEHLPSARVLERGGFAFEGILRKHTIFPNYDPDAPQDVRSYARPAGAAQTRPSPEGVNAIDHVELAIPQGTEQQAREFYAGLLRIPEVPRPPALATRGGAWFEKGALKIHVAVDPEFRPARKAHTALRAKGLEEVVARLKANGVEVVEDARLVGYYRVYVRDPFGNRLELMELKNS